MSFHVYGGRGHSSVKFTSADSYRPHYVRLNTTEDEAPDCPIRSEAVDKILMRMGMGRFAKNFHTIPTAQPTRRGTDANRKDDRRAISSASEIPVRPSRKSNRGEAA